MKSRFLLPLLWTLLVVYPAKSWAQVNLFDIYLNDVLVGQTKTVREVNDEAEKIAITLEFKVPSSGTTVKYQSYSTHMNGLLVESDATESIGSSTFETTLFWKQGHYEVFKHGKIWSLHEAQLIGIDLMFFEEPKGLKNLLDIALGKSASVIQSENGHYKIKTDESHGAYQYELGRLVSCSITIQGQNIDLKVRR